MTTTAIDHFTNAYGMLRKDLPDEPAWISELRDEAFESFKALGLPTVKHEEWRWTSLKSIASAEYEPAPAVEISEEDIRPFLIDGADELRLVFVNGRYSDALSHMPHAPDSMVLQPISRVEDTVEGLQIKLGRFADQAQAFTALNTATFHDGAYVRAGDSLALENPIHILHVSTDAETPAMCSPRALILAGENAEIAVIESFIGLGTKPRFVNAVCEVVAKQNAKIRHCKLLRETDATDHVSWNELRVERDASISAHSINLGARLARNSVNAVLGGEGADCTLNGLVLGVGSQHFDNHLVVDHVRPHCTSNQLYRSVVDDKSRSVFSGKVIVRPGADGTDAQQQNNNLLLSDDAKVDTKPQLEIYADDVKCSHGATSGQLDRDAIFFLRCRGLNEQTARNVLTYAFANDVIEHIDIDPAREMLEKVITERFAGLLGD